MGANVALAAAAAAAGAVPAGAIEETTFVQWRGHNSLRMKYMLNQGDIGNPAWIAVFAFLAAAGLGSLWLILGSTTNLEVAQKFERLCAISTSVMSHNVFTCSMLSDDVDSGCADALWQQFRRLTSDVF